MPHTDQSRAITRTTAAAAPQRHTWKALWRLLLSPRADEITSAPLRRDDDAHRPLAA